MPATTRSSPTPVTSARDGRTARKATAGVSAAVAKDAEDEKREALGLGGLGLGLGLGLG